MNLQIADHKNNDKSEIKMLVLKLFSMFEKENQIVRMGLYTNEFVNLGIEIDNLRELINEAIKKSKFLPSFAEIIKPYMDEQEEIKEYEEQKRKENFRIEQTWKLIEINEGRRKLDGTINKNFVEPKPQDSVYVFPTVPPKEKVEPKIDESKVKELWKKQYEQIEGRKYAGK